MSLTTSNTPGCVATVALCVAEALTALDCRGPFGATYVYNDTRRPQISVRERTFATSGPRATVTIK
jgi:hypothetical protein